MKSMKAVILRGFGGVDQLEVGEWPLAEPGPSEVRVRILAAAFNPADYKLRKGIVGLQTPTVLGFDLAGIIDAVGPEVTDLGVGDEIFGYLGGPKSNGSYAEYACVPAAFVARKPAGLTFPEAAAIPLTGLTAYQCVIDKAKVQPGEAILVAGGSGGLGTMAIQLARYAGASSIFTTAGTDSEAEYLTARLGIPERQIVRYPGLTLRDLTDAVLAMNGGKLVPVAFDFVGGDMKRLCCQVVDFDGRVVSTVPEPGSFGFNLWERGNPVSSRSASLHFEFLGGRATFGDAATWRVYREQLDILRRLIEAGHLRPPQISVLGPFGADTVRRSHALLEEGHVRGKLVMPGVGVPI